MRHLEQTIYANCEVDSGGHLQWRFGSRKKINLDCCALGSEIELWVKINPHWGISFRAFSRPQVFTIELVDVASPVTHHFKDLIDNFLIGNLSLFCH
jgi:hypothetical protein